MKPILAEAAKERLIFFQKTAGEIKMKYRRNLFNKKSLVLFENKVKNKFEYFGRDEFANSVVVKTNDDLKGSVEKVKILDGNNNTLFGEVTQNNNAKEFAA